MMKKIFIYSAAVVLMLSFASCQKTAVNKVQGDGFLSLGGLSLSLDESVITKSVSEGIVEAGGDYIITILDSDDIKVVQKTYSEVKGSNGMITLPAGTYKLTAASEAEYPDAAFSRPVYGVTEEFTITAGEVTDVKALTCTLLQCKVTVDYSPEFLDAVTGPGTTTVTLMNGSPLTYNLNADKTYEDEAGYFKVEGNTIEVVFSGSINGKSQKMRAMVKNVEPRQWRQVKFIPKKNEEGEATFEIVITDLISDKELSNVVNPKDEAILDEYDPEAPKGDGGISLVPYYEGGCDADITDLSNIIIKDPQGSETPTQNITLKAFVPNGVMKFTVDISTTSPGFTTALGAALGEGVSELDLINPDPNADTKLIFDVVPFPHGPELMGMTEIVFPLSTAQIAISGFKGRHTFEMKVVDQKQCRKTITVVMVVE